MRFMKESGIEWIGEIPENWSTIRMKSCITKRDSGAWGDEPTGETGDIVCLRVADFDYNRFVFKDTDTDNLTKRHYSPDVIEKLKLNKNDILIEKSGGGEKTPVGRTVIFDKDYDALFANFLDRLKCAEFINPRYMQYTFVTFYKNQYIRNYIKQTTGIQNLDLSGMLSKETVPFPCYDEQKKIADFLDKKCAEIDTVIEKTKATIEEYKKLKQSVITQAVTKGIRPNRPMKDSGIEWIGEIPYEWNKNSISNIATTCSGGTPSSDDESLYDGDINWICSYDLKEKPIIESGRKITQKGADSIAGKMQSVGSVLIAMYGGSGTIGNSGILECEARTNQAICSVKFNNDFLMDYFGFYYILSIRKHWMIYAVGTRKDPNISQDVVRRMPCIIPPLSEQEEIIDYLDKKCSEIDELISKKTALLSELESYKKSLIYEYVTGKKEV